MQHIPYKGSADAMNALIAGQVSLLFDSLPTALPQMRAGKVRPLGVTGTKRSPNAAEIPTIAETGLKDYRLLVWIALFAPTGTPREIINTLNRQTLTALSKTEVKERLSALAFEIQASTPDELGALLRSDTARLAAVVRSSGIRIE
jgi:tripartite-type tricarboxylate transporter receptor subunit TctC